jgi:hypothetical protein
VAPTAIDRERVVQTLSAQFANDRLSMDEFESRLEQAYKAASLDQLAALLSDLSAAGTTDLALETTSRLLPPDEVPPSGTIVAVMSGNTRKGSWLVPRHLKVYAVMGGVELDLREARFASGVTEIEVYVMMGGVEILVPPGVRVESLGAAFMGGFDAHTGDVATTSPLPPIIRLTGLAVMGGVEAKTKALGARGRKRAGRKRGGESSDTDQDL